MAMIGGEESFGLAGEEGVAVDVEGAGVALTAGATEGVDRAADLDVDEAGLLEE